MMSKSNPFTSVRILPSYSRGFSYFWDVAGDFNDEGPWEFSVQEGLSPDGEWKNISPAMKNVFSWREESRAPVNKSNVLFFRVCMVTPSSSYFSPVVQPYGTLPRRDFLLAREVMRQSVLHSKGMAGVRVDAYILSTVGPKCRHCLDPITGMIRDSHCKFCFGTGRDPAYNGPYEMWMDFSADTQHQQSVEKTGTVEKRSFQATAIGSPVLKHGDVIVDASTDKRYNVDVAAMTSEIRRVPIIQTLMLEEAPQTDKVYDI